MTMQLHSTRVASGWSYLNVSLWLTVVVAAASPSTFPAMALRCQSGALVTDILRPCEDAP